MATIRTATPEDAALILSLIRELAEYEHEPHAVKVSEEELLRDGFPENGRRYFDCLLAEERGEPAGIALYFPVYSTWSGKAIHLEDLYIRPQFRGQGIGKTLLSRVAAMAVEQGCRLMYWHVLDWNKPALDFYRSLGASPMQGWNRMQLTDESLRTVATGHVPA